MIQIIFFALLILTLVGGFFAYYAPSKKDLSPMKLVMDTTGYSAMETTNHKKSEQINMVTNKGLLEIRGQMEDLAIQQSKFLDAIQDQQQILNSTNKDATDILLQAQQKGLAGKDIFQLQALTAQMQNQQRLLVGQGQQLLSLNNQLTKTRQVFAEQLNLANINTASSLDSLKQRYSSLNDQASGFFDQVNQYNQKIHDQMDNLQSRLRDMANNTSYSNSVQQLMDRTREGMLKLAANEERCRNLTEDVRQKFIDSKERIADLQQKNKDVIADERQKEEDQRLMMQQRMADQEQRIQDQRNR